MRAGTLSVLDAPPTRSNLNGIVGGGQVGYNWQMQDWVVRSWKPISRAPTSGAALLCILAAGLTASAYWLPCLFTLNQKIDWFGTVRGRIGILATPKVLLYATGGLAYGEVNSSETIATPVPSAFSACETNVRLDGRCRHRRRDQRELDRKLEYLYVGPRTRCRGSLHGCRVDRHHADYNSRIIDNMLRVGVNYKFGGPVVASTEFFLSET